MSSNHDARISSTNDDDDNNNNDDDDDVMYPKALSISQLATRMKSRPVRQDCFCFLFVWSFVKLIAVLLNSRDHMYF